MLSKENMKNLIKTLTESINLKSPSSHSGDFKISKKVSSVNLSQISLLNLWLIVQIILNELKGALWPLRIFDS